MYQVTTEKTTKKTTVRRKFSNIIITFIAVISVTASLIHKQFEVFQSDLIEAQAVSDIAIEKRKADHKILLDYVYDNAQGDMLVLVNQYKKSKALASSKIKTKNKIAAKYKVNNFNNLEQFLYALGKSITILFSGLIILFLTYKIPRAERRSGYFASTAILSIGAFWVSWALFQNGDFASGYYYFISLLATILIISALWYLMRSYTTTNEKIKAVISFAMRARSSFFNSIGVPNSKAVHKSQEDYDNDLFETLDKLSK